jgi:low affinity Fe/Cu permease
MSRALHRIDAMTTRPVLALVVAAVVIASWTVIVATGFDDALQTGFATVCAGITVTMVFVLQHTQSRQQVALQLKLNELVRALPEADDHFVGVEASSDAELHEYDQQHLDQHSAVRDGGGASS